MINITTIFWDLDGTLIDSERVHEEAALTVSHEFGFDHVVASIPAGLENKAVFELISGQAISFNTIDMFKDWEQKVIEYAIQRIAKEQGIKPSLKLFNDFAKLGIRQAVVSNSSAALVKHALTALGILDKCSGFFSRDRANYGKPHPELYLQALSFHSQLAESCLAFEDSYSGITAARAAGLNVVGVGKAAASFLPDQVCLFDNSDWFRYLSNYYNFALTSEHF